MPHLSELHGASTHLAVVAIPVFAILHFARRARAGGTAVVVAEPQIVSDRDFAAIDAWLQALPSPRGGEHGD